MKHCQFVQGFWCWWTRKFGFLWKDINQKALRPSGTSFNIQSYSTLLRKQVFNDAICAAYINTSDLYGDGSNNKPTRKQKQCTQGLINTFFSDEFSTDFGCIGNTTTQAELDSGGACNNCKFWVRIQAAFKEPHPIHDDMQFPEHKPKTELKSPINLGENVQPHRWK